MAMATCTLPYNPGKAVFVAEINTNGEKVTACVRYDCKKYTGTWGMYNTRLFGKRKQLPLSEHVVSRCLPSWPQQGKGHAAEWLEHSIILNTFHYMTSCSLLHSAFPLSLENKKENLTLRTVKHVIIIAIKEIPSVKAITSNINNLSKKWRLGNAS